MGFFDTISSVFDSVSDQFSNYGNLVNNLVGGGSSNTGSMNDLATTLTSDKAPTTAAQPLLPRDDQWLRLSFILPADNGNNIPLNSDDLSNRSFSSASLKYTDTTPGGNLCINPPPQYTWYSDIHSTGYRGAGLDGVYEPSLNMKAGSAGMGRYYSESVDDSNQLIHMSFGVPEYNTLSAFFTGFYSIGDAAMARQGRYDSGVLGAITSVAAAAVAFCVAPLLLIPIGIGLLVSAAKFAFGISSSKFWTFKPTPHTYWMAVDGLVNKLSLYMGINQPSNYGKSADEISLISSFMPSAFSDKGRLNVLAISNAAKIKQLEFEKTLQQALINNANNPSKALYEVINNRSVLIATANRRSVASRSLESYIQSIINDGRTQANGQSVGDSVKLMASKVSDEMSSWFGSLFGDSDTSKMSSATDMEMNKGITAADAVSSSKKNGFLNYWLATESDGNKWASFRVDYTGTVQESFSNSVGEIATASVFNSMSKKARDLRISLADGNITGIIKPITDAVGSILNKTADYFNMTGLHALMGNAYVDIPKMWEGSETTINKVSYTMRLSSPYGNPISQLLNIYLPLCMLLAGTLPLSTGRHSHTSPFIVQLHDRGRAFIQQGIIDSLSITRGSSNLGFTKEGKALAIDVSFTVLDLSNLVSVAINDTLSSLIPSLSEMNDGENPMNMYMMAMAGMTLHEALYIGARAQRVINQTKSNWESFTNPARWGSWVGSGTGVGILEGIMRGSSDK